MSKFDIPSYRVRYCSDCGHKFDFESEHHGAVYLWDDDYVCRPCAEGYFDRGEACRHCERVWDDFCECVPCVEHDVPTTQCGCDPTEMSSKD